MTDVTLIRYQIKPGKTERLYEWMEEVESRRDEAIEMLQHGGVFSEATFLESREDGEYVSFYLEAENLEEATDAFEESPYELDHEFKQLLAEVIAEEQPDESIDMLYHLVNPERP